MNFKKKDWICFVLLSVFLNVPGLLYLLQPDVPGVQTNTQVDPMMAEMLLVPFLVWVFIWLIPAFPIKSLSLSLGFPLMEQIMPIPTHPLGWSLMFGIWTLIAFGIMKLLKR